MKKPKTVKAFLKILIELCDVDRGELKGFEKLTEEDYDKIGEVRAGIQNDLGEMDELLEKFKLKRKTNAG